MLYINQFCDLKKKSLPQIWLKQSASRLISCFSSDLRRHTPSSALRINEVFMVQIELFLFCFLAAKNFKIWTPESDFLQSVCDMRLCYLLGYKMEKWSIWGFWYLHFLPVGNTGFKFNRMILLASEWLRHFTC